MEYEALLFDLDGTLIDFYFQDFIKIYLGAASQFFLDLIPNPEIFYKELLLSTDVMENTDNDNTTTLEDFLLDFCPKFDVDCDKIQERFLQFYQTKYEVIKPLIETFEGALSLLQDIRSRYPSLKIVLATNPVFPYIAIKQRMKWGGIPEDLFNLITHAQNSTYCKYNDKYWFEISEKMDIDPKKSLVIGNDGNRDMRAKKCGFRTFLLESNLENEEMITAETEPDYRGSIEDLYELLIG